MLKLKVVDVPKVWDYGAYAILINIHELVAFNFYDTL